VIRSFSDKITEGLFAGATPGSVPRDVAKRALVKLFLLDTVTRLEDLRVQPGNRLEALKGNRAGQHSIRINDQWRICFTWKGRQGISAAIALRLGTYFGVDPQWFMNLQGRYELRQAAETVDLTKIQRLTAA
jgi:toxin HigB-1